MKSKLLLSLGLVAILGMAQASEVTPEVGNIMEMFARLSPEQKTVLLEKLSAQGATASVVQEEASAQLPKWMAEKFGTKKEAKDVNYIWVDHGEIKTSGRGMDKWARFECNADRLGDLLKAIAGGVFKNIQLLDIDLRKAGAEATQTLINYISEGKLLNMRDLRIDIKSLDEDEKMRLEQTLLNSHSSSLEELWVTGASSFEFAKAMCARKESNFPQLNVIGIVDIPLDKNFTERHSIMRETGVLIRGRRTWPEQAQDTIRETELYQEWEQMHSQQD